MPPITPRRPIAEAQAGLLCLALFLLWRFGYPVTSAAMIAPAVALLLVGTGIYLRHVGLTEALREGIFLPRSTLKTWFRGRLTGVLRALIEGGAIVLAISHFSLQASFRQLLLAAAIGTVTLTSVALLRRVMASQLRPEFAVAASVWTSVSVGFLFSLLYLWLQWQHPERPAYLDAGGFVSVMQASLADLPARRDGAIEVLSAMQLFETALLWILHQAQDIAGIKILIFMYNSAICIAIARFFADIAAVFNLVGLDDDRTGECDYRP